MNSWKTMRAVLLAGGVAFGLAACAGSGPGPYQGGYAYSDGPYYGAYDGGFGLYGYGGRWHEHGGEHYGNFAGANHSSSFAHANVSHGNSVGATGSVHGSNSHG
jgi:hypothetical protein